MDAADFDLEYITIGDQRLEVLHSSEAVATASDGHEIRTVVHVCRPEPSRVVTLVARHGLAPHAMDISIGDPEEFDEEEHVSNMLATFAVADPWPTTEEFEEWIAEVARVNGGSQLQ